MKKRKNTKQIGQKKEKLEGDGEEKKLKNGYGVRIPNDG